MTPTTFVSRCIGCALSVILPALAHAQWEDVSLDHAVLSSTFGSLFGCGISTADFNGDGWDDVTVSGSDGWVNLYTGGPNGLTAFDAWEILDEGKAVLWFDIENDGDLDLLLGVLNVGVYLYVQQSDGSFSEEGAERGLPTLTSWNVRGFSARDYDNDGDLDVYIASYHDLSNQVVHENILLRNSGAGYFQDVTAIAGVGNGYMHSFQGTWMDFDDDGFEDLWVINDRSIFPNALYRNLGNGTFTNIAADTQCDIGIEAMSATLFDPDNDGDWDQYITNIENNPNAFLRNNNGTYEDIAALAGVASMQYGWGACAIDVNGDRWDDLMVATYRFPNSLPYDNHLYLNLGTGTEFVDMTDWWPNEQLQLYCLARLDLDGDRAPDIIGHGNAAYDQVLLNTNPDGAARLTVDLVGTTSNSRGVGAVIKVHADGLTQMRQVDAGCDYMTQHTYTQFFGLGVVALIDSIEVFWPAGSREVLYDVPSNSALMVVEGTANAQLEPVVQPCPWADAAWVVPFDPVAVEMTWNGVPVTSDTVVADSSGQWVLEASWWSGGVTWSEVVTWEAVPEPEVSLSVQQPACFDEPGLVSWLFSESTVVNISDSIWGGSAQAQPFAAGFYDVEIENLPGCIQHADFEIFPAPPIQVEAMLDLPACHGELGGLELVASGGTPPLTLDFGGADPQALSPGTWSYSVVDSLGCSLMDSVVVTEPDPLVSSGAFNYSGSTDSALVEVTISGGTPPYSLSWSGEIGADNWVVAPVGLGWFIQDAQGCLDLGVLEVPGNPLATVGALGVSDWGCTRIEDALLFSGPDGGQLSFVVLDMSGRVIQEMQSVPAGAILPCALQGPVVLHARDWTGRTYSWLR